MAIRAGLPEIDFVTIKSKSSHFESPPNNFIFTGMKSLLFAPFGNTDQDALNATVEACDTKVSLVRTRGNSIQAWPSTYVACTWKTKAMAL